MWLKLMCVMAILQGLNGENFSFINYFQNGPIRNVMVSYLGKGEDRISNYGKLFEYQNMKPPVVVVTPPKESKVHSSRRKRGIMDALKYFYILRNVSQPCQDSFVGMISSITGILSGKFPATLGTLIDASGKYTSGTMRGNTIRKGNYQECIEIKDNQEPGSQNTPFVGQFCLVTAKYDPNYLAPDPEYKEYQIYPGGDREIFQIQVCVPSVCNPNDVASLVNQVASFREVQMEVTDVRCHYPKDIDPSAWTIFVLAVCFLLACIHLAGTVYNIWLNFQQPQALEKCECDQTTTTLTSKESGFVGQVLLCFSIPRNMAYIFNDKEEHRTIREINGIRFLTFCWINMINIFLIAKDRPWVNYMGLLEDLRTLPAQLIFNGRLAADTLFCTSGFLAAYVTLQQLKDKKKIGFFDYILHRYWRLVPSSTMVMLIASGVYYYTIDGPDWMNDNEYESQCMQHSWKGLLFINNFFNGSESCPTNSWYLASQMQLHLMAPFVISALYKMPYVGIGILLCLGLVSTAITTAITVVNDLPYFIGRLFYFQPGHEAFIFQILMKPWAHATPFLIGIFYGFLLHKNVTKPPTSLFTVIVHWLVTISIILAIVFGFYPYIDGTREMSVIMGLLYTSLVPTLWAAAIGWIIFQCATKNGGIVSYMLSWGVYDWFGRISYSCFLVNSLTIHHFMLSRADSFYYDKCTMMLLFIGALCSTLVPASVLSVAVERPCYQLEKLLIDDHERHDNVNKVKMTIKSFARSTFQKIFI